MLIGPVLNLQILPPIATAAARDIRGAAYMSVRLKRMPVDVVSHAQQLGRILHGYQGDAPVVFVHADG